ncbi:MAG: DUF4344 domain-containing metallopeptidase [Bacteroidota bacterium]
MQTRLLALFLLIFPSVTLAQTAISAGDFIEGQLEPGDATLDADDSFYDAYLYRGDAGESIEITLTSSDFDAYLIGGLTEADALGIAEEDDDSAGGTDARLAVTTSATGEFWIFANTYAQDGTGAYVLSVRSLGGGTPVADNTIRSGQTVNGALTASDAQLSDGSFFDDYTYEGTPGETLTITLTSSDFDAFLYGGRMENGRFVSDATDDDGAGGSDAQMTAEVGFSGRYTIRVNSYAAGSMGRYTLTVEGSGGGPMVSADVIRPGGSVTGTLGSDDDRLGDGSYFDFYEIEASAGEALEITLASDDFDAFLVGGTTPDGAFSVEVSDDDGAGGTDAQLRVEAGPDGRFFALANTYAPGLSGSYVLSVRSLGGGAPDSGIRALAMGETVTGELTSDDPVMSADNTHFDLYTFEGTAGEEVEISLSSDDFDTYLLLRRAFGGELENVAEDDDGGTGINSRIRATLDRSGTYVIGANTYTAGATGRYTLTLARPDDAAPNAASDLATLRTGEPVLGVLEASDTVLADTSYADLYVYRGNPGDRVAVTLRSDAFDTYLAVASVEGENLEVIARDNDGAGGTDSRVEFTVGGSGIYAIQANSLLPRVSGAYSVVVERASAPPPTANTNTSRFAGKWAPIRYEPSDAYDAIRDRVRSARRLETTVASLNEAFPLPRNVPVSFEECGMINAQYLYRDVEGRVRFCYELMEYLTDVLEPQVGPDRLAEAVSGAYEFIMLHEAGHALRHQLDLPITGREEDVADQFAALTLIRQGTKGARAAIDGVLALQSDGTFTDLDYAGEHSLGPQRLYNVICLVYGSDPDKYQGYVGDGGLPESRAVRCPAEYAQVEKSFDRLLGLVYGE